MYKIIACDLDETLLNTTDKKVSAKNVAAIKAARELGVKFVPATGRNYPSVDKTLKELDLFDAAGEYLITCNGGVITENKNHKLLYLNGLPFDLADELYRRGLNYDVCIHVYMADETYVYNFVQSEVDFLSGRMAVKEISDKNLDFLKGQEIVKILYMNTEPDYLGKIAADLQDITQDIDVSYSSNRYIEFNRKGVTKGAGLIKLAEMLGVKIEETIAIGDNFNDLPMIKAAGLGVGVKNCVAGIKKYCDYITAATCNESAVAEVIDKFILGGS